jgi:hypothetical protein
MKRACGTVRASQVTRPLFSPGPADQTHECERGETPPGCFSDFHVANLRFFWASFLLSTRLVLELALALVSSLLLVLVLVLKQRGFKFSLVRRHGPSPSKLASANCQHSGSTQRDFEAVTKPTLEAQPSHQRPTSTSALGLGLDAASDGRPQKLGRQILMHRKSSFTALMLSLSVPGSPSLIIRQTGQDSPLGRALTNLICECKLPHVPDEDALVTASRL